MYKCPKCGSTEHFIEYLNRTFKEKVINQKGEYLLQTPKNSIDHPDKIYLVCDTCGFEDLKDNFYIEDAIYSCPQCNNKTFYGHSDKAIIKVGINKYGKEYLDCDMYNIEIIKPNYTQFECDKCHYTDSPDAFKVNK